MGTSIINRFQSIAINPLIGNSKSTENNPSPLSVAQPLSGDRFSLSQARPQARQNQKKKPFSLFSPPAAHRKTALRASSQNVDAPSGKGGKPERDILDVLRKQIQETKYIEAQRPLEGSVPELQKAVPLVREVMNAIQHDMKKGPVIFIGKNKNLSLFATPEGLKLSGFEFKANGVNYSLYYNKNQFMQIEQLHTSGLTRPLKIIYKYENGNNNFELHGSAPHAPFSIWHYQDPLLKEEAAQFKEILFEALEPILPPES